MSPADITRHPHWHQVEFATTDPDRAEAHLGAAYDAPLALGVDLRTYRFRHVRLDAGSFHLDTVDHQASTDYHCGPFPVVTVARIHRGLRTDVDLGERLGPGDLVLHAPPGRRYHLRQDSVLGSVVSMAPQAVAEVARNRPDDPLPALRFTSERPAGPAAARHWVQTVAYLTDSLTAAPAFITHPLLLGTMTRLLAATMLTTFPNASVSRPHPHDRSDATPTALSRAIIFIDTNADLDISVVDIARAARVTARAVQLAFRRHLDTTPTAYLRRVRLERAHEQLMAARPGDGATVTEVAARCGFADPDRFTAAYRETYRRLPSRTLHD